MFRRFCLLFLKSSPGCWAVLQLPCCPSKQGEPLENILQNLRKKWPPHPVHIITKTRARSNTQVSLLFQSGPPQVGSQPKSGKRRSRVKKQNGDGEERQRRFRRSESFTSSTRKLRFPIQSFFCFVTCQHWYHYCTIIIMSTVKLPLAKIGSIFSYLGPYLP